VPEPIPVFIPRCSVNDDSVQILAWKVPAGILVEKDQLICEVETSKAVVEIYAPQSGVLAYTAAEGDEIPVGATICTIAEPGEEMPGARQQTPIPRAADSGETRLTAAARVTAAELGIDLSAFPSGSLVRRDDVLRKAGKLTTDDRQQRQSGLDAGPPVRWEDLPRRKAMEGRILRKGRASTVQSSVTSICRAARLLMRLEDLGLSTTGLQAAIIYEAARLLRKYPMMNASYDSGRIGVYEHVNVGWALDGGMGLVVPVIPDADRKSVPDIAAFMERQLEAYLDGALTPGDFSGATFTVTDLSGYGVSFFEPLIAPGQAAILGIGKGPDFQGQTILHLTLAFDHQVTEGKRAAEFLQELRARMETHASLASGELPEADSEESAPYCVLCHRDRRTLQRLKLVLLKSEIPAGFVCSLCVAGW
jgi:pyruvate dehydrogenase E2 component (dihydrolipoamide acetyltransferase)